MAKPLIHAKSSARKFGGKWEDYINIHNLLDLSKGAIPDSRHRALTHTSWFLSNILELVFGVMITNSDGRAVSVRDVGEQHIIEDFGGIIPTAQDFLQEMEYKPWMEGSKQGNPPSYTKIANGQRVTRTTFRWDGD